MSNYRVRTGYLVLAASLLYGLEGHYLFGAHLWPTTANELLADGLAFLLASIGAGLVAWGNDNK